MPTVASRPVPRLRIDLHTHSTWSDGTTSVAELLEQAAGYRLDAIALTDHDTTAGWEEARAHVARTGVMVIPGIEVSCEHGRASVHVLALLADPAPTTELAQELEACRASRRGRAQRMVTRLAEDFPLTWDDVRAQAAGEDTTLGRPHIADALVAAGVVRDRGEAFATMLAPSSPYYVPHAAPSPEVAVAAIRKAGGVAIAAHPASTSRGGDADPELLEAMIAAGLHGIEVDHREHSEEQREHLRALARRHGLLVTGGSDYHGRGKPNRLGENLTAPEVLEEIISLAGASPSGTEVLRP